MKEVGSGLRLATRTAYCPTARPTAGRCVERPPAATSPNLGRSRRPRFSLLPVSSPDHACPMKSLEFAKRLRVSSAARPNRSSFPS